MVNEAFVDMSNMQTVKRGRSDLDDTDATSTDIIQLLHGLNSKIDVLTTTVSDNSLAINNIDAKLTAKIDNLDLSVADSIIKVKVEVDSKINDFATDVNQRFNGLVAATKSSLDENAKVNQEITSKLENMQYVNESRFNKLERESLRNELIVTGVPTSHGESMFDIIGDMVNALQSNITSNDVVSSF